MYIQITDKAILQKYIPHFLQKHPESFVFDNSNRLIEIYLYYDFLVKLPQPLSYPFKYLKNIEISSILNDYYFNILPDGFCYDCPNLETVRLCNNGLNVLPDNFLKKCPNLKNIYLNNNKLTKLPNGFLEKYNYLENIYIGYNNLRKLTDNFYKIVLILQKLI